MNVLEDLLLSSHSIHAVISSVELSRHKIVDQLPYAEATCKHDAACLQRLIHVLMLRAHNLGECLLAIVATDCKKSVQTKKRVDVHCKESNKSREKRAWTCKRTPRPALLVAARGPFSITFDER